MTSERFDDTVPGGKVTRFDSSEGANELPPGFEVNGFVIQQRLGAGGFGTVYLARQALIDRKVAIKVLNSAMASQPDLLARFLDEARAATKVRHRNVIDIFQFGQLPDGRPYQIMEFLEGETLASHLARTQRLSIEQAMPLFRAIGRALDLVHDAGIVHRDLKPENVFLTTDDEGHCLPKLLDFGIAKLTEDGGGSARKSRTGIPVGTPTYMSPEQCRGHKVDAQTDVYSFGALVFETLTGSPPFNQTSAIEVMNSHLTQPAPAVSSVWPGLPAGLDAVVASALAKDPAQRPARASQFVAALASAANDAGAHLKTDEYSPPIEVRRTLQPTPLPTSPAGLDKTHLRPSEVRSRRVPLAVGAALAAIVLGALLLRSANAPAPTQATPAPAAVAPPPVAPPPAPEPQIVHVNLDTGEVRATVYRDGVIVGETGQPFALPKGPQGVRLVLKAESYADAEVSVIPVEDVKLTLALQHLKVHRPEAPAPPPSIPKALEDPFRH